MSITRLASIAFLALSFPQLGTAQPLPDQQASLALLTSLRVELQLIGAAESAGLTELLVLEAVESRLRDAGLTVRDRDDRSERGDPRLRVTIQVVDAAGGYAFLVSVQMVERVVTYRKYAELVFDGILPTRPTASVTPLEIAAGIKWEAQALGTTRRGGAANFIPDAMLSYVDRFVEDYLAANPQ